MSHYPAHLKPGETWLYRCPHRCGATTQNGVTGLGAHLETVHPDKPWPPDARPYAVPPPVPMPSRIRSTKTTSNAIQPALFNPETP
ncbi:hypothetical protein [Streptomyces sp. NBC_01304]|uniref:hypothetical protein n=1 Tax=Streptomyces sp. NBC_01304 TaxID=2903818 RepID=UPI002E0E64FD|nr:hypothetical protein OG430_44970 [Streptomyces sp. NBC_01304]